MQLKVTQAGLSYEQFKKMFEAQMKEAAEAASSEKAEDKKERQRK